MASRKKHQIATMGDGRESASHEPNTYTDNDRLNLEKSLSSIALLMVVLTDLGNEELDGRVAQGLAIALNHLADRSQVLYSKEEMAERGGRPWNVPTPVKTQAETIGKK
jgi:hypothetical protein